MALYGQSDARLPKGSVHLLCQTALRRHAIELSLRVSRMVVLAKSNYPHIATAVDTKERDQTPKAQA